MDTHEELFIKYDTFLDKDSVVCGLHDNYHTNSPSYYIEKMVDSLNLQPNENSIVYAYKCSMIGCDFVSHHPRVTKSHETKHSIAVVSEYPQRSDTFICPYRGCYYVSSVRRYWKTHMRNHIGDKTFDSTPHDTIDDKNVLYLYICSDKKCRDFISSSIDVMVFHRSVHLFIAGVPQETIVNKITTTPTTSENCDMDANYDMIY